MSEENDIQIQIFIQPVEQQPVEQQPVENFIPKEVTEEDILKRSSNPKTVEDFENKEIETANKELLLNLVSEISESISDEKIEINDILNICVIGMKFVERLPKLSGEHKKKLVINALEIVCQKVGINDNSILSLIPTFIDIVISLDKKKIYIKEQIKGCCSLL